MFFAHRDHHVDLFMSVFYSSSEILISCNWSVNLLLWLIFPTVSLIQFSLSLSFFGVPRIPFKLVTLHDLVCNNIGDRVVHIYTYK